MRTVQLGQSTSPRLRVDLERSGCMITHLLQANELPRLDKTWMGKSPMAFYVPEGARRSLQASCALPANCNLQSYRHKAMDLEARLAVCLAICLNSPRQSLLRALVLLWILSWPRLFIPVVSNRSGSASDRALRLTRSLILGSSGNGFFESLKAKLKAAMECSLVRARS